MTVASTYEPPQFIGDGLTKTFGFPFPYFAATDLAVEIYDTSTGGPIAPSPTLNGIGTYDFTVNGTADTSGTGETLYATVTLNTAPNSNQTVSIIRSVPAVQNTSLTNNGPFPAKTIESALDRLTIVLQQALAQTALSIRAPATDPSNVNLTLPAATSRASQLLSFDAAGNITTSAPSAGTVLISTVMQAVVAASTAAAALALLGGVGASGGLALLGGMQSFATIAALRANSAAPAPTAYIAGYYAGADGGEGTFWYNSADRTSADNGGSIIVDAGGHRWYREMGKKVLARQWGAKGDGTTDDTAALQAAINYAQTSYILWVDLGEGSYNTTTGITITANGMRLSGNTTYSSSITSSSPNTTLLTIMGTLQVKIEHIWFFNNRISTAVCAMIFVTGATETHIDNVFTSGGYYGIYVAAGSADTNISNSRVYNAYQHQIYLQGASGNYLRRVKIDQSWPVSYALPGDDKGNWAPNTAVSRNWFVRSGGFYWQCNQTGVTGTTPPTPTPYGSPFTDGTVVWYMAGSTGGSGICIDSGCYSTYLSDCDLTGAYLSGLSMVNSLSAAPQNLVATRCIFDANVNVGADLEAGNVASFDDCQLSSTAEASGGTGLQTGGSFGGDLTVTKCRIFGNSSGIILGAGVRSLISGNTIVGNINGIYVGGGISYFTVTGNNIGSSALWGANSAYGILVTVGTSDHYIISQNLAIGAATPISDGGTGTNKSVTLNF